MSNTDPKEGSLNAPETPVAEATLTPPVKRKPGRPRKNPQPEGEVSQPTTAPAPIMPVKSPSKKALLQAAREEERARQIEAQKPMLEYISTHTAERAPAVFGIRARSKTAPTKGRGAGKERPTLLAMLAPSVSIVEHELSTPNAEMDFAHAAYPIEWRLATNEETIVILARRAIANGDKDMIAPPSNEAPFFDRHIRELRRGEAKKQYGAEVIDSFFPTDQKQILLVPTVFDGFQPLVGDRLLVPYGGEGDYFAVASFGMIPEDKRETCKNAVMRCTPGTLKQTRERAIEAGTLLIGKKEDPKDKDHILLAHLLTNPSDASLQAMTHEERVLIELRAAYQAWMRAQEWRKKLIQFAERQAKHRAYLEVGYDKPLFDMEAIVGESLHTDAIDAIVAQEEAAKKRMAECLEQILFAKVLLEVPQVGASIAGGILSALNNLDRFRKNEYNPYAEIDKLVERIGQCFIRLGFKETIGGPTLPSILAEVEAIPLDSLPEKSDLWHMRQHVTYPSGNEKTGRVHTWNCLHLLLDKWEKEVAAFQVRSPDMVVLEEVSRTLVHGTEPIPKKRGRPPKKRALVIDPANTRADLSARQQIEQRIELAQQIITLLKRKHRLEQDLRKYGVDEVRVRRMIGSVQKFMGVFVITSTTTSTGEQIPLPPDQWHFARHERGVIGGYNPIARQAVFNLFTQAMKDCNRKKGTFGPMRRAFSLVWFAYKKRHPKVETVLRGNTSFDKYTPKYCIDAARWQFLGKFIDWMVRAYLAFTAGQPIPEHFHLGIIRDAEAYYAEAPGVLPRAFALKSTPEDLAWKPGDPPPPDPVLTADEDDEPNTLNQDAPAT